MVDYDVEREIVTFRGKVNENGVASYKKRKFKRMIMKEPGPISKSAKTLGTPGASAKENSFTKKASTSIVIEKGLSRKER